jgi:alpha-tubulin suppressor-like RCC1 family protein
VSLYYTVFNSWTNFSSYVGTNEFVSINDLLTTNYNWESSSFGAGSFYLPTNSLLINRGSTNAGALGLYWFTTQTNQTIESNSTVDIGYHFVAVDTNGNPLDTDVPGTPNYISEPWGVETMTVPWGDDYFGECSTMPSGLTNVIAVSAGEAHSIALKSDGTVLTWGSPYDSGNYVPASVTNGIIAIAAGAAFNDAVLSNGNVIAWGNIATNYGAATDATNVPANATNVAAISAANFHSLALRTDGTVVGWGDYTENGELPPPGGLSGVVAIAAGSDHDLAVESGGTVVAWGGNDSGQCNVPAGLSGVVAVSAAWDFSLALKGDGTVVAWGDDTFGETDVPSGLSNVVAIAAGGNPFSSEGYPPVYPPWDTAVFGLALTKDGRVVTWGSGLVTDVPESMTNVFAIAAGNFHAIALRTGPLNPVIIQQPVDQYQAAGGSVTFTALGQGLAGVGYQWQFDGMNLSGATNATLTLSDVQTNQFGTYDIVVTDNAGAGSIMSSNATLYVLTAPTVISQSPSTPQAYVDNTGVTLSVTATAPAIAAFPLSYQWQFDGTNIPGAASFSNFVFTTVSSGTYSVIVSNAAGSATAIWPITVVYPGAVIGWGLGSNGQLNASSTLTNVISLAAGEAYGVAALDSGSVSNWGSYWTGSGFVPVMPPPTVTNAIAVAAGSRHDLALLQSGTVVAWGLNDFGQTNVPANATNVTAIAAGGQQSLALLQNGTVLQWGQTNTPIPIGLTNVTAIAAGTNFCLALLSNSTVVAWGVNNFGQTNIPSGLSNVVAIAAGGAHALALRQNGTVVAWGDNAYGETNVPAGLSNVLNIAAGDNHSIALENNGTVVVWGGNTFGETNGVIGLTDVKLIAGGDDFILAVQFSPTVMYPVNVSQDLLLVYNANSSDSSNLCNYYLEHRPMVANANVLGVNSETGEFYDTTNTWDPEVVTPVLNWLTNNPTKHPTYIILFYDIPTRIWNSTLEYGCGEGSGVYVGSTSYQLYNFYPGWKPFVNNINAGNLADCEAYVEKIADMATNTPGQLLVSASAAEYGNTNYVIDNVRTGTGYGSGSDYTPYGFLLSSATNSLIAEGILPSSILFNDGLDTITTVVTNGVTNAIPYDAPQILSATNVAGYISWGAHSAILGNGNAAYATNGVLQWSGNSGWWLIETIESFNGMRGGCGQGDFIQWYSSNAFGGTNYSYTPVGAVSHVEEPSVGGNENSSIYFGLWGAGRNFAICAWKSRQTPYFQAVGDPFVKH